MKDLFKPVKIIKNWLILPLSMSMDGLPVNLSWEYLGDSLKQFIGLLLCTSRAMAPVSTQSCKGWLQSADFIQSLAKTFPTYIWVDKDMS